MIRAISIAVLCLFAAACGIYQSKFDCPPGEGIGCKPVSEVLDMIVDKEDGEDLFIKDLEAARHHRDEEKRSRKRKAHYPQEEKKLHLFKEHEGSSVLVEGRPL